MKTRQETKAPKMINGKMMQYCVVYNVWVNMEIHMLIGNIMPRVRITP